MKESPRIEIFQNINRFPVIALLETLPPGVLLCFVAALGLVFGSFVTLASARIPQGDSIVHTRSRCPSCLHVLGFRDLLPLFSWLLQQGRCRYCKVKIHFRYPLIELIQMVLFLSCYFVAGISFEFIVLALLSVMLLILIVIDFEHKIIPDGLQIAMAIVGVVYHVMHSGIDIALVIGPLSGFASAMALRLLFSWWKEQEALGLGDVKFLAVAGLFLTPELIIPFLLMSGVIGIATAMVWQKVSGEKEFPFGPALAASLFLCVLLPEQYNEAYRQLISWLAE
ncbi:MAG: prepilin peptidase [Proteobacteria bacterium]|nr:prepilin peptidase [Pseudomonadota bacterium]